MTQVPADASLRGTTIIRIPAMVLIRVRSSVIWLVARTINLDRLFSAWATTERTHFEYG